MRARSVPIVVFTLILSFSVSSAHAGWLSKITDAAKASKEGCESLLSAATEKAAGALGSAADGAAQIQAAFQSFADSVNFEGVGAGISGGASGVSALFWKSLSPMGTVQMAWRILRFNPDVEGLREGMFGPMTDVVNRLCVVHQECAVLSREESAKKQVEIYGELILVLFEVTLKTYKLVPQVVMEVVPTGLGTFLPILTEKNPESIDELVVMVMRQFIKNAFKAVTSRGLTLEQRFNLLNVDMATIQASGKFAEDAGIVDFLAALSRFRANSGQAQTPPLQLE